MNKSRIAKKLSRSLINTYDISDVSGILKGLQIFSRVIDSSRELKLLFSSRIFTDNEKVQALKILISHLKVSRQTEKFLKLIILQGYLPALKEIIKASTDACNEKLKKASALLISPVALEQSHIDRLKNALRDLTKRDVDIDSKIDPSLLGGFIVKVGSTVYDSSLKGQLRLLRTELTKEISMN
ncbi:MAG: ATP synthase F1 subunit delta [Thermodesulfovibrionia bacterium]|nr:ATP synthase F1 subunit delta [Thermodesulfovibrionia bacterium]